MSNPFPSVPLQKDFLPIFDNSNFACCIYIFQTDVYLSSDEKVQAWQNILYQSRLSTLITWQFPSFWEIFETFCHGLNQETFQVVKNRVDYLQRMKKRSLRLFSQFKSLQRAALWMLQRIDCLLGISQVHWIVKALKQFFHEREKMWSNWKLFKPKLLKFRYFVIDNCILKLFKPKL